jgi:hypothetical protein
MKIKSLFVLTIICFFSTGVFAESAAVTGLCKDGTEYTGTSKKGACRGHKGIKEWYGDKADTAAKPAEAKEVTKAAESKPAAAATGPATGLCKDGTEYTGASKKGACRGHKGLKEWYADKKDAPAAKEEVPAKAAAPEVTGAATGLCKDGTEYTGETKKGACRGHKGLKEWYADKAAAPAPKEEAPAKAAAAPETTGVATGLCKYGTEYTGASKKGACRGHKGIKEWYADKETPAAKEAAPAKAAAPADEEAEAPAPPTKKAAPAPAAGSGQVWVNTNSKIYHCEGSKFYGNTKEGEYMSEADAQTKGYIANRKKVCN